MGDYAADISVIIPIYNVEKFLYRCLSSVACQTFKNYEVIMIDDGSTDNSIEIARRFSENFKNFRLVDNPVKGVANARNLGIMLAQGKYVAFVDSDDYVDPNYLLCLYEAVKQYNADIAHCNYILYHVDMGFLHSVKIKKPKAGVLPGMTMVRKTISDFHMRSYLWNKLWKKSLFTDNHITFPDMKFEDIATVAKLLYYAETGVMINRHLYYYTVREGSIVQTASFKSLSDYLLSFGMLRRFFIDNHEIQHLEFSFLRLALSMFAVNLYYLSRLHRQRRNARGYLRNIGISVKNILYFYSRKFNDAVDTDITLPYAFIEPENKNKDNTEPPS